MMVRFLRYCRKVFDIPNHAEGLSDPRPKPQIPISAVFTSAFLMCATRLRSLNALETELREQGRWEKIIGKRKPSADSMGRIVNLIDPEELRQILSCVGHRLRRNKVLDDAPWPLRFVAIDGHEFFSQ